MSKHEYRRGLSIATKPLGRLVPSAIAIGVVGVAVSFAPVGLVRTSPFSGADLVMLGIALAANTVACLAHTMTWRIGEALGRVMGHIAWVASLQALISYVTICPSCGNSHMLDRATIVSAVASSCLLIGSASLGRGYRHVVLAAILGTFNVVVIQSTQG